MTAAAWWYAGTIAVMVLVTLVVLAGPWRQSGAHAARPMARSRAESIGPPTPHSMYERVGMSTLRVIVDRFYRRVLGDDRLAHFFEDMRDEDLVRLKRHQALLFSQILGGPVKVDVSRLADWHSHLGIDNDIYAVAVSHLYAVMVAMNVDSDIVKHFLGVLEDVRPLIVSRDPFGQLPELAPPGVHAWPTDGWREVR